LITSTEMRKLAGGEDQAVIKGGVTEPLRKLLADWEGAHRGRGRRTLIVAIPAAPRAGLPESG